ncbi:MAG: hypothetical protein ACK4S2_14815 [Gemmobacter sp.]|uniref:hypothetical protein n=1 Tax=Gemmobacter sp. TaxID=1898957 RepID=UPI00391BCCA3
MPLGLAALTLAPVLIVLAQAVRGPVLANWAVLFLVPGSILGAMWLAAHRRLALLSLSLGLAISVTLPLLKVAGPGLTLADGRPALHRYLGHADVARWAIGIAQAHGARVLVAQDRDLLADLSWFSVGTDLAIRAVPSAGRPRHHWEMTAAFDPETDPAPLVLLRQTASLPCPEGQVVARHLAGPGFAGGSRLVLLRLPDPGCLTPTASGTLP